MVCRGIEWEQPEDWASAEAETMYFCPRHHDIDGLVSLRVMRLWDKIRAPEAIDPPVYLEEIVRRQFYLSGLGGQNFVESDKLWLQHTGVGKHTLDIATRRLVEEKTGIALMYLANDPFIAGIKSSIRKEEKLPPMHGQYGAMSLLQEIEYTKRINELPKGGVAITWGSHLALLENNLIRLFSAEMRDFMGNRPGLEKDVFGLDSINNIIKKWTRELEDCWKMLATNIHRDMNNFPSGTLFWPFIEIASPITAIQDVNVPTTWALQEIEDAKRPDKRPGGDHPFSAWQLTLMRLIAATMVYKFPEQFVVFGGYRSDYQAGGAVKIAEEMLLATINLYQQKMGELQGDSRVIAGYLADIVHR